MSPIIENYYRQVPLPKGILERKAAIFDKHTDIAAEFEHWIETGSYVDSESCLSVEGYSAEQIAATSQYLDGEGAFVLLAELRENPDKAKHRIQTGISLK